VSTIRLPNGRNTTSAKYSIATIATRIEARPSTVVYNVNSTLLLRLSKGGGIYKIKIDKTKQKKIAMKVCRVCFVVVATLSAISMSSSS
jgi:coenzyme F420-reducing hydrogenase beta subunit